MPLQPCPHCGKDFDHDNAGARQQHVNSCEREKEKFESGTRGAGKPTPRQEGGGGGRPAQGGRSAEGAGGSLVEAAIAATDDDVPPEVRGKKVSEGLSAAGDLIGGLFSRYQQYRKRRMEEEKRRAERVELEEAVELPECECGYQFMPEDVGLNDERVQCPDCSNVYNVRDPGGEVGTQ